MFQAPIPSPSVARTAPAPRGASGLGGAVGPSGAGGAGAGEMAGLLDLLARASTRPRYAFMVLSLIAEAADGAGKAGPFVPHGGHSATLRDWLCDSLTPMGGRDPRRIALARKVRADLAAAGSLPADAAAAAQVVDDEVRDRVRASGKTNLSRAVSELVRAGLLRRYYAGYAVDHANRGGQRHAVYVLQGLARCLLPRPAAVPASAPAASLAAAPVPAAPPVQGELRYS